jgi:hypothetical protein
MSEFQKAVQSIGFAQILTMTNKKPPNTVVAPVNHSMACQALKSWKRYPVMGPEAVMPIAQKHIIIPCLRPV